MHLDDYYKLLKDKKPQSQLSKKNRLYDYLDHESIQSSFCQEDETGNLTAHLYFSNLECYACTWVCEKAIKKRFPDVKIQVNLAENKGKIIIQKGQHKISEMAQLLDSLGYPVSANKNFKDTRQGQILNMGLAFFCLMNVMLLSSAEYLSSDLIGSKFYHLFRYISLGLATLAIAIPAQGFYKNSWRAIRTGGIHLDIPIALAIIFSYAFSAYNTILKEGPVFFDSMLAVIFLLLVGRYIQSLALAHHQRKFATESQDSHLVRILDDNDKETFKEYRLVNPGDRLRILPGDIVPVRSRLESSDATINWELITGEEKVTSLKKGESIPAGSYNCNVAITVESLELGSQSELYIIEESSSQLLEQKGQVLVSSDRIAKFLVSFVLIVSAIIFFAHAPNWEIAISRSVATLLIACPCAFGLGAPLIISRALQLGLNEGLLFRTQKAIETLPLVKEFFFDKTGTLTVPGNKAILDDIDTELGNKTDLAKILAGIAQHSNHHVIKALSNWSGDHDCEAFSLSQFREDFGQGVSFQVGEELIKIGRADFAVANYSGVSGNTIISKNHKYWASFQLKESLQKGCTSLIEDLQARKAGVQILSGDKGDRVDMLVSRLNLDPKTSISGMKPHDKLNTLQQQKTVCAMIGNGINDSMAMAASQLSIAVHEASHQAKASSDILLLNEDLSSIGKAMTITTACRKAFKRSFRFAFAFNLIGISLGASGYLSPVVAAIFMPISSITVLYLASHWEAK